MDNKKNSGTDSAFAKTPVRRKVISISYDSYKYIRTLACEKDLQLTEVVDLLVDTHKVVCTLK